MKALHLCLDGNFISSAIKAFDKYVEGEQYYAIFSVDHPNRISHTVEDKSDHILRYEVKDVTTLKQILALCREKGLENVVLHGLCPKFAGMLPHLKSIMTGKVYWIFWGYELYNALGETNKYKLLDNTSVFIPMTWHEPTPQNRIIRKLAGKYLADDVLKSSLPYIDYFCFWMDSDFDLLKSFYDTHARFKYFQYSAPGRTTYVPMFYGKEKDEKSIIIGHQASATGNHDTVIRKLARIKGIGDYTVTIPLSYGRTKILAHIRKLAERTFGSRFKPILDYIPKNEYFETICRNEVAVFGQLRQEASGNVSTMIKNGVKIFLREKNPMYAYFKKCGYIVFSFEKDLNTVDDLQPLTEEQRRYNRMIGDSQRHYCEDFMTGFFDE